MVLELILPILVELVTDPIKKYILSPITRHTSYAFKCDRRVQTLQDEVVQLKNKKDRLQQCVVEATRNGEEIYPNVTEWLSSADRAIEEAEELLQWQEEAKKKCFVGLCPNLKTRYQISKNSVEKASTIHLLRNDEGLDSISFRPPLQPIVEPSVYNRESLPSRVSRLNQIMDALRDPNLNMVGVYGMGGVGKTTLAKEVQAKAMLEKLFETVVVVAVSQAPELRRIQGEIADLLGLKFDVEEIPGRASQLYKRLENSRVLIVLDDLWQKLDLDVVGIPSRGASKVCKIMLTSRNRALLSNEMGAQKLFSLETLKEEETLSLFQMSVAEANDPNFHAIAAQIAMKCGGLPLLIQIVAAELKNQESHVWNDTLNKLSTFGDEEIHEKVYKVLESSYENLPGKELKSFFLLCAFFGQSNIRIQHLLTYSVGLGLFKHIRTIEDARDKVLTLITKLKAKSLLLDGDMVGFIKMHDVVRDTALNIASRVQHAFVGVSEVRLRDWPDKDCTRISLPFCGVSELPLVMDCPEVELFLLFTEDLFLQIPDSFFSRSKRLKVLDFTGLRMASLPSSAGLLTSLQTLCLHKCRLDNVAVLGELKQLELLSFAGSEIVEIPREIEALTRLKLLDVRDCSNLHVIPESVLSNLCSLEDLYMLNSFVRWGSKGNASLAELDSLPYLSTLEIEIADPKMIPVGFHCFSQLRRYKISIGNVWDWNGQYEKSRTLKLKAERGIHLEDGIVFLLKESEDLYLNGVKEIENIFYEGFPQLKLMHIESDYDIQSLIKSTSQGFPVLSMYLTNLLNLEKICCSKLGVGSFRELQILKISKCDKLTSLFPFSSAKCLQQLRELEVKLCENMEAVIKDEHHNNEVIEFSHLTSLKLENLPHLTCFCNLKEESEQMGLLFGVTVTFPNLTSLVVNGCGSLKHMFTATMVKCLMQLKELKIYDCELMEEIIKSKKMDDTKEGKDSTKIVVFPELDYLSLQSLKNVKRFGSCCSIQFPLLRELRITDCHAMVNFLGRDSSSASEEHLFSETVTFSNLETMSIWGMNRFKFLWDEQLIAENSFFKLKFVDVGRCSNLLVVFPSKICARFQRVERLSLFYCDRVEEIFQGIDFKEINDPFSLRELHIYFLQSLKHIWNTELEWNKRAFSTFQNLQSVTVRGCGHLKYVFPASVFPKLTELELWGIKELRSLYDGGCHTFDCPMLKSLKLVGCSNFPVEKFISNLEEIIMDEKAFYAIHYASEFPVELHTTKLKRVTLMNFSVETSIAVALSFVSGVKSLEMLAFEQCSFGEASGLDYPASQKPIGDEQRHHLRIKHLELRSIGKLKHIVRKASKHLHLLQTLLVQDCWDMINLSASSTSLQNLTTLYLEDCGNVKNLVTASTAKTMVQLREMKIVGCRRIEEIVAKGGDSTEHDMISFNRLKFLELANLPNFNSFCSDTYGFTFPLLERVSVKQCPRMNSFCGGALSTPELRGVLFEDEKQWEENLNYTISSQLRKWVGVHFEERRQFRNLESLELVNNEFSSEAISANQMLYLNKLKKVSVRNCCSMQVAFDLEGDVGLLPPKLNELELINLAMLTQLCSKAPEGILDFSRLKELKIEKCSRLLYAFTSSMVSCLSQLKIIRLESCEMMETVVVDEEDAADKAIFGALENFDLKDMPKFSSIYRGRGELDCPSLKNITMMECPSIKAFISTPIQSTHRVLPKLEKLSIDMKSMRGMMQFEANANLFPKLKTLQVWHCSSATKSSVPFLYLLSSFPLVDELWVGDSSLKMLFDSNTKEALSVPPVNCLTLRNLLNLTVYNCNQLINLITPSIAKDMVQLQKLRVESCKRLMEVIRNGSIEIADEIVFHKLEALFLNDLPSLEGFSSTHCNFKFPCLDRVVISGCPKLRTFCSGTIKTPMLKEVQDREYFGYCYWDDNLNTTTEHMYQKMVGLDGAKEMKLSAFPMLKEKWEAHMPSSFFSSLERLEVDDCELFSNAIPSHLLQHMECLKVLIIKTCDSVEQVIDLEVSNANECGINKVRKLEELQLIDLPRLKQVWSKDPQHILSFRNLKILKVHSCGSLVYIFNLSMASSLQNLQHVEVKNCNLLKYVIMIAEVETTLKTVFPSLLSMDLLHLTNLLSFCSTNGVLKCPYLKKIEVVNCPNVELFGLTDSSLIAVEEAGEAVSIDDHHSIAAFLGNKMAIPGLEELKVEWKTLKDELVGKCQSDLFSRLKCIDLAGFQGKECAFLPPTFRHHFPLLEKLVLSDAYIEEINLDDLSIRDDKDQKSMAPLTKLKLSKLPNLKHLVHYDCQSAPLFQNLVDLKVVECSSLKILLPSSVSFPNLVDLEVSKCDGLMNLISASTARSLVQLRRMKVKDCKMMLEIIDIASDGEEYEIRFSQLEYLELDGLPCITCFSSGNYNFCFPSLQEVKITGCPGMRNFSERVSVAPKLRKVQTGREEYEWEWEGSLNDTIQALHIEKLEEEKAAPNVFGADRMSKHNS